MLERITAFFKEVQVELRKVNWPTRNEATRYTVFVLIFSGIVAAFLGFLDFLYLAMIRSAILR